MVCLAEGNVLRVLTQKKNCRLTHLRYSLHVFYLDQPLVRFIFCRPIPITEATILCPDVSYVHTLL